jgi:hypothetical protein
LACTTTDKNGSPSRKGRDFQVGIYRFEKN